MSNEKNLDKAAELMTITSEIESILDKHYLLENAKPINFKRRLSILSVLIGKHLVMIKKEHQKDVLDSVNLSINTFVDGVEKLQDKEK